MIDIVCVGVDREKYRKQFFFNVGMINPVSPIAYIDEDGLSYSQAINKGVKKLDPQGWFMICNNDVQITKMINPKKLKTDTLYGFERHGLRDVDVYYLVGWAYILHRSLWDDVGPFDEEFYPLYFEDVDYCLRVLDNGYKVQMLDQEQYGIKHLDQPQKVKELNMYRDGVKPYYNKNMHYLKSKHGLLKG
jgi:hypothetical protein